MIHNTYMYSTLHDIGDLPANCYTRSRAAKVRLLLLMFRIQKLWTATSDTCRKRCEKGARGFARSVSVRKISATGRKLACWPSSALICGVIYLTQFNIFKQSVMTTTPTFMLGRRARRFTKCY